MKRVPPTSTRLFSLLCLISATVCVTRALANDNYHLERLLVIQAQVSEVVSKNMPACVAVTDGVGFGSGVIINENGLILTAGHVMAEDGDYEVIMPSGRTVRARPLGKNLDVDTGMIQIIEPGPWPYVEISETGRFRKGDWVVSLGHSGGFELGRIPPVRTGRILTQEGDQIVTDAALIGGDSGGPLFDLSGKLIAIHSSIGDSIAENRHVTVGAFKRDWKRLAAGESWGELPDLNEPGKSKKPGKMGVRVDRTATNARIREVKLGSPAEESGIRVNDVVVEFDNVTVRDGDHLIELIKGKFAGRVYPLTVLRNGRTIKLEILLR